MALWMPGKHLSLSAIGFVATLAGLKVCAPSPVTTQKDLVGVWKNEKDGDGSVLLNLREDGTFIRRERLGEWNLKMAGIYRVEDSQIRFVYDVKQIADTQPEDIDGYVRIRYKFDGVTLVMNPDTKSAERYILI